MVVFFHLRVNRTNLPIIHTGKHSPLEDRVFGKLKKPYKAFWNMLANTMVCLATVQSLGSKFFALQWSPRPLPILILNSTLSMILFKTLPFYPMLCVSSEFIIEITHSGEFKGSQSQDISNCSVVGAKVVQNPQSSSGFKNNLYFLFCTKFTNPPGSVLSCVSR